MDLVNIVRVLLRHWLPLLLGLTLVGVSAYAVYRVTPRSYEATSQIMLLLRPTASDPELETSPFLYLPDGLTALARVVTLIPNTPGYRASMAEDGFEPAYTVELQARDPIVLFTVEGSDPANALRTRDELMARFAADLDRVQEEEGVPDRQWAHFRVLQTSDVPTTSSGTAFKRAAGVGVFGGLLTLLGIALLERRAHGRVPRTVRESPESGSQPTHAEDEFGGSASSRSEGVPEGVEDRPPSGSRSAARDPVHASETE